MEINLIDYTGGLNNSKIQQQAKSERLTENLKEEQQDSGKTNDWEPFTVELSDEAKQMSELASSSNGNYKQAGTTSEREEWETDSAKLKNSNRYGTCGQYSSLYTMQLYEPETYAKWEELNSKCYESYRKNGYITEEAKKWTEERGRILSDWVLKENSFLSANPTTLRSNMIDELEKKYSDSHDLSINVYCTEGQDERVGRLNQFSGTSLWRYSTKYNMLLTSDMLKKLMEGSKEEKEGILKLIDDSVNKMKEAEKNYEGDKIFLRFGAKFHTDGSITYHANYKDCEDPYGVQADNIDELVKKISSKETTN